MSSLRDEITRTFLRFGRRGSSISQSAAAGDPLASESLPEGAELGTYRVLRRLGAGGMGQVYLALDTHLNRKVALKVLPLELTENPAFLRRFQQEAKTASALNHPNILTILEFPEIAGRHIIVSEYIEGQTLRAALHRQVDLAAALDVALQIASALTAAHAAGVIHRDLKPTNIMIRPDGYVKIIDFGLAKLTQRQGGVRAEAEREGWTLPGAVLGTVGYMSPEQARGEEVDARSDIWSLGVILYEMVAHSRPFEGTTDSHVIVAILDDPPRQIPHDAKMPAGLIAIISRALAKEKKARYQSAEEVLNDLHRVQASMGVASGASPWRPKLAGVKRSSSYLLILGVLALCIGAFALWWGPFKGRWKVLGPRWFEIGSSRRLTFQGDVMLATISPDGQYLAYVAGSAGNESFRLLELHTNSERQFPTTADSYKGLTFSSDSKTLFYVLKDMHQERGRLFSIPVTGIGSEPASVVLEDLEGPVTLSPGGDRFAFVRGKAEGNRDVNQIFVGSASNPRNVNPVVSLYGTEINAGIAWSPGGDWFAGVTYPSALRGATRVTVSLFSLDGRALKSFAPEAFRRLQNPIALDGGSLLAFPGFPQGGEQNRLAQLFVPTGAFHQAGSGLVGFESLSATSNSQEIAAVMLDERSSVWTADATNLQSPHKLTSESERISSLDWLGEDALVFPSARSGNVNLMKLQPDGKIVPLAAPVSCVQNDPAVEQDGSRVVYAANCADRGDDFNLWTADVPNHKVQRLTSGSNFDYQPSVSPDGRWVYYTSWASNIPSIWKVAIDGGMPSRVLETQAQTPVVSPDSTKITATLRADHGQWRVAVISTSDGTILQKLPQIPIRHPVRWSVDGKALDYVNEDRVSAGIWRQPLAGGTPQLLLRVSEGTIPSFAWNRSGTKLAYIRARDQKDAILFSRAAKH